MTHPGPVYNLVDPYQAAALLAGLPTRTYREDLMRIWRRHYGQEWARQVGEALRARAAA